MTGPKPLREVPSLRDVIRKHDIRRERHPEILYSTTDGSVSRGWVATVDRMFQRLIAAGWNRRIIQIKEKFGALEVYMYPPDDPDLQARFRAIVAEAREECSRTCETCGGPCAEAYSIRGYIRTLCRPCMDIDK